MTPSANARTSSGKTATTRTSASNSSPSTPRNRGRCRTCCEKETMRPINRTIVFAALIAIACTATLRADDSDRELKFVETQTKRFTYRGGHVTLSNSFGHLNITAGSGSAVEARITVRADDPELGRSIKIITSESDGISIRTDYPNVIRNHSWSVDYDVTVPANAPLVAKNRFGSIEI